MAAMELLCHLVDIDLSELSKREIILIEAELFACVCEEFKEIFRNQYKDYFHLMQLTKEEENDMLDNMFVRLVISDILASEEYSLKGVAYYIDIHEDVVQDIMGGRNTDPSATLFRRTIDLHRTVRRDLYRSIMRKIAIKILE